MSSDSSEDESLKLREAIDSSLINDDMFKENKKKIDKEKNIQNHNKPEPLPKSLRPSKQNNEQFNNLDVTPEFQKHVAKHLSRIIDTQLKEILVDKTDSKRSKKLKKDEGGIRLLSNAPIINARDVIEFEDYERPVIKPEIKKRKLQEEIDENVIDKNSLKLVAVSPEFVLSRLETKHWSNRTKHPPFEYKKLKNGKLEFIEPENEFTQIKKKLDSNKVI